MEQFIYPTLTAFFASFITFIFSKRKNLAENRAAELDNAVNAVKYYRDLLDDMANRLTKATDTIREMEEKHRQLMDNMALRLTKATDTIKEMDLKHRELMDINKHLVDELQKFKQLNGKV